MNVYILNDRINMPPIESKEKESATSFKFFFFFLFILISNDVVRVNFIFVKILYMLLIHIKYFKYTILGHEIFIYIY